MSVNLNHQVMAATFNYTSGRDRSAGEAALAVGETRRAALLAQCGTASNDAEARDRHNRSVDWPEGGALVRPYSHNAYQPIPAVLTHWLGLARRSHPIRSLSASKASIRAVATTKNCSAVLQASASEARKASFSMVSSGAVMTIMERRSLAAFSAVSSRGATIPGFAASTASIQGHKALASTMGKPDVSRARGIGLEEVISERYSGGIAPPDGMNAARNDVTTQKAVRMERGGHPTNEDVIPITARTHRDQTAISMHERKAP